MHRKSLSIGMLLLVASAGVAIAQEKPSSRNYLMGPGDVVEIKIFAQPDLSTTAQVDSDGFLSSLAFVEPIDVKCRNERDVQKSVNEAYRRLLKDPQVSVRIVERNSRPPATVFGAVRKASKVAMVKSLRLNELIAESGGVNENAAGTIQILHTEPVLCPGPDDEVEGQPIDGTLVPMKIVKISDLKKGTIAANPIIRPGDLVLVPEAEPVYINGSVVSPGGVLLRDQLTLSRALGMVGGPRPGANLSKIKIYRQKPGADRPEAEVIDFEAIKQNRRPDVVLKPYDMIEVPESGALSWGNLKDMVLGLMTGSIRNTVIPR